MTAIGDFCNTIREWMNWGSEEYPDALVTTFVRMGEEYLNSKLRIANQVDIDQGELSVDRVTLPADWLESDFVRIVGGSPLKYKTRDAFYTPDVDGVYWNNGHFTTIGRYLIVGGTFVPPTMVEISYFAEVPVLDADPTWLSLKFPSLHMLSALMHAGQYFIEDERSAGWATQVDSKIDALNLAYKMAQPSGSRLNAKTTRSFG